MATVKKTPTKSQPEVQTISSPPPSLVRRHGITAVACVLMFALGLGVYPLLFHQEEACSASIGEQYGPIKGYYAPLFTLKDASGQQYILKDQRGKKTVVVVFEVTTCTWCKQLSPALEALRTQYDDVVFWSIDGGESAATIAAYRDGAGIERPWLLDTDGAVSQQYGVQGTPNIFIIDKTGKIAKVQPGYVEQGTLQTIVEAAR
jgi:peroxiredoxin